MPVLYLLRHGVAEDASAAVADEQRELTDEGRRKTTEAAAGLRALGVAPEVILTSPLVRARQTAELTAQVLEVRTVETYPPLAPAGGAEAVVRQLKGYSGAEVMLVGHQPDLGELASYLLTGSQGLVPLPFKKGAVAAIEVGSIPPRVEGELLWFISNKQLRHIRES